MLKFCNSNIIKYIVLWLCLFASATILYISTNKLETFLNASTNKTNTLSNNLLNVQSVPAPLTNFTEKMDVFSHAI